MLTDPARRFPLYELISTHLLPALQIWLEECTLSDPAQTPLSGGGRDAPTSASTLPTTSSSNHVHPSSSSWHALLVSHHLKSPHKRCALSSWARELALSGFAKVPGHPGVIHVYILPRA